MQFWELKQHGSHPAVIDARTGQIWSYDCLAQDVARAQLALPKAAAKSLGLLLAENRYECLVAYLAALKSGSALILLDANLNAGLLAGFIENYRPDWIYSRPTDSAFAGYRTSSRDWPGLFQSQGPQDIEIHPDLAILLNTSGSTGSPKLVRLTLKNLAANAGSIAQCLEISAQDRPITSLPMAYSYGLSVINSHLHAGACIVLTEHGVLRREFWDAFEQHGCTSLAGVPYTYQMLLKAGLLSRKWASLRSLTQAGGKLNEPEIRQVYQLALARGWKFFVMYGQTEATARISYVPFEQLGRKIGSVGVSVPGGSLAIDPTTGELLFSGANVMLGYAQSRKDLAKGDELRGELRTGDLARKDDDGYFYIVGRLKRFLKMFGKRFSLDEVESILSQEFGKAVACFGHDDFLVTAIESCTDPGAVSRFICETFNLPRTAVSVASVPELPRTANGKVDHHRLAKGEGQPVLAAVN